VRFYPVIAERRMGEAEWTVPNPDEAFPPGGNWRPVAVTRLGTDDGVNRIEVWLVADADPDYSPVTIELERVDDVPVDAGLGAAEAARRDQLRAEAKWGDE
jgi:hypothetical protein